MTSVPPLAPPKTPELLSEMYGDGCGITGGGGFPACVALLTSVPPLGTSGPGGAPRIGTAPGMCGTGATRGCEGRTPGPGPLSTGGSVDRALGTGIGVPSGTLAGAGGGDGRAFAAGGDVGGRAPAVGSGVEGLAPAAGSGIDGGALTAGTGVDDGSGGGIDGGALVVGSGVDGRVLATGSGVPGRGGGVAGRGGATDGSGVVGREFTTGGGVAGRAFTPGGSGVAGRVFTPGGGGVAGRIFTPGGDKRGWGPIAVRSLSSTSIDIDSPAAEPPLPDACDGGLPGAPSAVLPLSIKVRTTCCSTKNAPCARA